MRRSGNEHDDFAEAGVGGFEPLAGSAAVGIGEKGGAFDEVGLLEIVFGHADAPCSRAGVKCGYLLCIALEAQRESFSYGLARKVVFGGTESAHEDQDVGTRESGFNHTDQVFSTIADNRLEGDSDAQFVELLSEIEGVRVLAKGRQHLGADSDDFGFHEEQPLAFSF